MTESDNCLRGDIAHCNQILKTRARRQPGRFVVTCIQKNRVISAQLRRVLLYSYNVIRFARKSIANPRDFKALQICSVVTMSLAEIASLDIQNCETLFLTSRDGKCFEDCRTVLTEVAECAIT